MQGRAEQSSAGQRRAVRCSAAQSSAVQRSAAQRSAVVCRAEQSSAVRCGAVQCGAVRHNETARTAALGTRQYSRVNQVCERVHGRLQPRCRDRRKRLDGLRQLHVLQRHTKTSRNVARQFWPDPSASCCVMRRVCCNTFTMLQCLVGRSGGARPSRQRGSATYNIQHAPVMQHRIRTWHAIYTPFNLRLSCNMQHAPFTWHATCDAQPATRTCLFWPKRLMRWLIVFSRSCPRPHPSAQTNADSLVRTAALAPAHPT